MGQLRPVQAPSVFAHELVDRIPPNIKETVAGVDALYGAWLWRQFTKVVILRKNFRAIKDPEYTNLLARIRLGLAWDGKKDMTSAQSGDGSNYAEADFQTLHNRQLVGLPSEERALFADAPIVCATRVVRDVINYQLTLNHSRRTGNACHFYHSKDRFQKRPLNDDLQKPVWQIRSTHTKDALGKLPLSIGMKVMITENIALKACVVNGAEGILREIHYSTDSKGRRSVDCAYVEVKGAGVNLHPLGKDVVPIFPVSSSFKYEPQSGSVYKIARTQLPLVPAYAFTDYKSQGRSLERVIVDLNGARSLQSLYVMISRATSLNSMSVLRNFTPRTLHTRLGEDFRREFERLEELDALTKAAYGRSLADRALRVAVDEESLY
ncbi:hypothetical protein K438DRAFT_1561929 [Mycena galopus ATCC 62051]|nr:hypothetical protein K438DRAFT_1561929 [Mycena galopus ATCC 62051]